MRKARMGFLLAPLLITGAGLLNAVSAQPTDAQVKKQLTHAKTVSVELGKPGKVEWSKTYKKWVWNRSFTAKLKTDEPDIFVIVKGYASYDVMAGRYVFWKTFTTSNNYEGIPNPTAEEVQALISKFGLEQILGQARFRSVVGKIESIGLAEDPKFTWHTTNQVTFNVVAVYTERTNDVGGQEKLARTIELRLYRDNVKDPWRSVLSTDIDVKRL